MLLENSDLADEMCALNAIYGENSIVATFANEHHSTLSVKFPLLGYSFLLRVLHNYPESPPEVLGVDDLVESTKPEVLQNAVYFGACIRAVHHPETVCLFDAIEEFEAVCRSLQAQHQQSDDTDQVSRRKAAKRAVILRDLAVRARSKSDPRPDYFTGNSPFDVVDCSSCLEPFFRVHTAVLKCRHSLCAECLDKGISSMSKLRAELTCCGQAVPCKVIRQHTNIKPELVEGYVIMLQEIHAPNPTYCPWEGCFAYIPRRFVQEDYARCHFCKRRMCMGCKKKEHAGICRLLDRKLQLLVSKEKWQFCPSCGHLVARSYGCNHMTCSCGNEFCYRCGENWAKKRAACDCGLFATLYD